ncbi:MAG TPA: hypothetical protein VD928_03460 [Candidatus Paceibacterota bacterium]|nr:hypothetical protein [Candidatus Paceibacterota bacterium]
MLSHTRADAFARWLRSWGLEPVLVGPIFVTLLFLYSLSADPFAVRAFFVALVAISPVWVPILLLRYFWVLWMRYIRYQFWFKQDHVLLEVTLPPEVQKSPLAMEVFLTTLWNSSGELTFIDRIWKGGQRMVWSLEIASTEGQIRYYIYMRRTWRNIVESRLYGQFPEARVIEAVDYAWNPAINFDEYELWGLEYDKQDIGALPIKTYRDYELDKNTDEPEMIVDPFTHILEFFGSIGKDEHLWLQYIVRTRRKDEWFGFTLKRDEYKESAREKITDMIAAAAKRSKDLLGKLEISDPEGIALKQAASRGAALLSEGERNKVEAIERSLNKLLFECGIRGIYVAKKDRFAGTNNGGLVRMFDPFRAPEHNVLNPTRGLTIFDYPWQDFQGIRRTRIRQQLFFHYRHRAYFFVPYDQAPVFLTTEELATLWHFPSSAVQPPGLQRVAAKRAEAPPGLPTNA